MCYLANEFALLCCSASGITDQSKRLQYNFYDGTNLLVSEYIKKIDNVLQALYDPGVEPEYGQVFTGWAYSANETDPSKIYTIDQLNQQATGRYNSATQELTEIDVYAMYDEAWYLRYMDEDEQGNAVVLNVVRVKKDAANKNVTIDYTYTPEEGIIFQGWTDAATGDTYQQGNTLTLDHHVDLYVKVEGRYWLVFDSNKGSGASSVTYTPPQLLQGTEVTKKPDDPVRKGYTFKGWNTSANGNGTWWYRPGTSTNLFGSPLPQDTTLYAIWEAGTVEYYVVFWKQSAGDAVGLSDSAKKYEYVESVKRTALTDSTVNITTADTQKGGTTGSDYGYYFVYNANNSDTDGKNVSADGTTILNVYYDRRVITYNFTSDTNFTVPSYYGTVDGERVELTKQEDGTYTYQKTVTTTETLPYTGTRYNKNMSNIETPQKYGFFNGIMAPLYYGRNFGDWSDKWWITKGSYYGYTYYSDEYDGDRYIVSNNGSFGVVDGNLVTINNDGTYSLTTTTTTTEEYTGEVQSGTITAREYSADGLYGSAFAHWPDLGNSYTWSITTGSGRNARTSYFPMSITLFDPAVYSSASSTATELTFVAIGYQTQYVLIAYGQSLDGEWIDDEEHVLARATVGGGTWTPSETFEGFTIAAYRIGENGTWQSCTNSTRIEYNQNLYLRYSRNKHSIKYISQGANTTGRTENTVNDVYYATNISSYGKKADGSWYYEPTNGNEGYYFVGWYEDEACNVPFDFNTTMPDGDIVVYAKWDTFRVRVVLVPTVNNEHNDEVQFANNQALTFRMDYNETVKDENINSSVAKRAGYKLIGWYYSPDFNPATEVHFPLTVNKDTDGVDMGYQDSEDWKNYGDNDGAHDNVKAILKLYAKWELDVDTNSVYVEYDVDDQYRTYDTAGMLQTTIPVDDAKYALTNDNVTFQVKEAPTNYTRGFEFYRWVLLNPDGSESDVVFNPGGMADEIPSSFIYEETITDDLGHTATIKKLRLKAQFNIETDKVTTVTYNGNGGVTNDSASQASVTESYPINKDFNMKGADSFVREGYTLIGWAFDSGMSDKDFEESVEQHTVNDVIDYSELAEAGLFLPGEKVAADNEQLTENNNWNPLANTIYAVWKPRTFTVTIVKKLTEESNDGTFSFAQTGLTEENESFELQKDGKKKYLEVPYDTEFSITEASQFGYMLKSVEAKQTSDSSNHQLAEADYIDLEGSNGKIYTVKGDITITFTNEESYPSPTGLTFPLAPYALMLAVGVLLLLLRRRRRA